MNYRKVILFLITLTLLDFLLRKGLIGHFLPFHLPYNLNGLLLYTAFTACAWLATKKFGQSDQISLNNLGISLSRKNKSEFLIGFLVGVIIWGIVAVTQSLFAGFSWTLRHDFNPLTLVYGLLFIFIADLGTELYTRGYPLTKLKDKFGAKAAISIMVLLEVLKSFAYNWDNDLFLYATIIPAIHIVFFSIIYLKTKRLGASLGIHTGANFITISVFDLRIEQPNQLIPAGIFQANADLENLSIHALQLPWIFAATIFSIVVYIWSCKKNLL